MLTTYVTIDNKQKQFIEQMMIADKDIYRLTHVKNNCYELTFNEDYADRILTKLWDKKINPKYYIPQETEV